jgi:hypothetical protein
MQLSVEIVSAPARCRHFCCTLGESNADDRRFFRAQQRLWSPADGHSWQGVEANNVMEQFGQMECRVLIGKRDVGKFWKKIHSLQPFFDRRFQFSL